MAELLYNKAISLYKCAHLADTGVNRAENTFTMHCPSYLTITGAAFLAKPKVKLLGY